MLRAKINFIELNNKEITINDIKVSCSDHNHPNGATSYKVNINNKNIIINFYTNKHSSNPEYRDLYKIFIMLYLLTLYSSKKCSKSLTIDIYFTPFKRSLPKNASDIIGPININGGFTYGGCMSSNKITVYREEEWFKVLIHELFHNLDLDFAEMNIDKWRE